jgi:putative thioredoxin
MKHHEMTDFEKDVLSQSHQVPVVVDFWAAWCGPCRVLGPILEKLEGLSNGAWKLVKVDTDEHQDIAARFGIRGIPAVKLFVDGKVIDEFTGALPEPMVKQWLSSALPNKFRKDIGHAGGLIATGRQTEALPLLERVVKEDPANEEGRVLLAGLVCRSDPERAGRLLEGIDESSRWIQQAEAVRTVLHMQVLLKHPDDLPESDVKGLYLRALQTYLEGNADEALGHFIEVIRKDRYYDDDGARKACIAIFRHLGDEHETTLKWRRAFGSALNS